MECLTARGFSDIWITWIQKLVLQGHSQVILNFVTERRITLKRGVRQGDPLSPYLFNIVMDVLALWIQSLNERRILKPIYIGCRSCLLYADDTLIFVQPTAHQLNLLKILLDTFGNISGLKINMQKSELLVTSTTSSQVQQLAALIQCKSGTFPLKYLGPPLSDKQIPRQFFKQLIDGIQDTLPGWQAEYLSLAGREILVNAVLSAKTVYFMSLYLLPKWVIKAIDNIRRRFMWHRHKSDDKKPMCLVNWGIVTMSKQNGGLGIRDLHIMNQSFLAKWM
jgi:Reverse transcriptase (RNA-dependent DNA polymerase)